MPFFVWTDSDGLRQARQYLANQPQITANIEIGPFLRDGKTNDHQVLTWHHIDALAQNTRGVERITRHAALDAADGVRSGAPIRPESCTVVRVQCRSC